MLVSAGILAVSGCSGRLARCLGLPSYLLGIWWFVVAAGSAVNLPLPWQIQAGGPTWNLGGTVLPAAFGLLVLALMEDNPRMNRNQTVLRLVAGALAGGVVLSLAVAWCLALPGVWWVQPLGILALATGAGLVVRDARDGVVLTSLALPLACGIGPLEHRWMGGPAVPSLGGGLIFDMAVSSGVVLQVVLALSRVGDPLPMELGSSGGPPA